MKCKKGRPRKRYMRGMGSHGKRKKGYTFNRYAPSYKGHTWKKMYNKDDEHIERECINENCKIKIFNFRGRHVKN